MARAVGKCGLKRLAQVAWHAALVGEARIGTPARQRRCRALHCSGGTLTNSSCVFYLEGSDGGSTQALYAAGFKAHQLFVANLFPATCAVLP